VCKLAAVGQMIHKYDEIICSIHQGGHPASHHDPPVGGPWWGSFAKTNQKARAQSRKEGIGEQGLRPFLPTLLLQYPELHVQCRVSVC